MDGRGVTPAQAVEYPTRDGRPMGETDDHRDEMKDYAINVLKDFFAADPDVYVSGNNFLYYTEGVLADCVSPDTYVIRGVANRQRDTFKVWEEGGKVPCFVLEVTSKNSRREDLGDKMVRYRDDLGVPDYFLFDPRAEWVAERLRGFRLENGLYQPVVAGPNGRLLSQALGLELGVQGRHLRFFTPGSTQPLATRAERADAERQRAEAERQRAERAEAEIRRLQAEVERFRREAEGRA